MTTTQKHKNRINYEAKWLTGKIITTNITGKISISFIYEYIAFFLVNPSFMKYPLTLSSSLRKIY